MYEVLVLVLVLLVSPKGFSRRRCKTKKSTEVKATVIPVAESIRDFKTGRHNCEYPIDGCTEPPVTPPAPTIAGVTVAGSVLPPKARCEADVVGLKPDEDSDTDPRF